MCAEFTLRASQKDIEEALKEKVRNDSLNNSWDAHIRIRSKAPVVLRKDGETVLEEMSFSLKPPSVPYSTFNARLSNWDENKKQLVPIFTKPTWRKPFETSRCLVPMTGFIEPIYRGERAGTAQEFKSKNDLILFAAGLYERSVDQKTGEVYEGFAPILHTPSEYILQIGHHRMLLFLKAEDALHWIQEKTAEPKGVFRFLMTKRYVPDLEATKFRALAKNWEKKCSEYEEKHAHEVSILKLLEASES
jgi:putative SOS response-associated peptidase YedK